MGRRKTAGFDSRQLKERDGKNPGKSGSGREPSAEQINNRSTQVRDRLTATAHLFLSCCCKMHESAAPAAHRAPCARRAASSLAQTANQRAAHPARRPHILLTAENYDVDRRASVHRRPPRTLARDGRLHPSRKPQIKRRRTLMRHLVG